MKSRKLKLAIFDLGNVVINTLFMEAYKTWSKHSGVGIPELMDRFQEDEKVRQFDRNEITEHDFFDHLERMFGINIGFERMLEGWNAIFGPIIEQTYSVIVELKREMDVVALTNTNCSHCSVWKKKYEERFSVFDDIFISSEMGMRKPEKRIFEHVLSQYNVSSNEVVFFDDMEENILVGRELGIESVLVENPNNVENWMKHRRDI
jgi:putative hydrolase of the HAD superfamily